VGHRELQLKYKGNNCAHCGQSVVDSLERFGTFHRLYHFNHVDPNSKHPDYDNLIRRNISTEQLDELDKCVLLCANCHGAVHAQNINISMILTVSVGGQTATQTLRGQVIFDRVDQKLSFFTDNELEIWPYWLNLGDEPVRLIFGKELKDTLMTKWVPLVRDSGPLAITDSNGDVLFGAIREGNMIEVQQTCKFSLIPVHAVGKEGTVWFRNGLAILKWGNEIKIHEAACYKAMMDI
jgi:hypothetical protein